MSDLWDSSSSEDELQKPQLESKDHQIALSDEEWESVDDIEYLRTLYARERNKRKELEVRLDLVTKELNSLKLNATNVVVDVDVDGDREPEELSNERSGGGSEIKQENVSSEWSKIVQGERQRRNEQRRSLAKSTNIRKSKRLNLVYNQALSSNPVSASVLVPNTNTKSGSGLGSKPNSVGDLKDHAATAVAAETRATTTNTNTNTNTITEISDSDSSDDSDSDWDENDEDTKNKKKNKKKNPPSPPPPAHVIAPLPLPPHSFENQPNTGRKPNNNPPHVEQEEESEWSDSEGERESHSNLPKHTNTVIYSIPPSTSTSTSTSTPHTALSSHDLDTASKLADEVLTSWVQEEGWDLIKLFSTTGRAVRSATMRAAHSHGNIDIDLSLFPPDDSMNPVGGISLDASDPKKVRQMYLKLVRKLHPDRFSHCSSQDVRVMVASKAFTILQHAYSCYTQSIPS